MRIQDNFNILLAKCLMIFFFPKTLIYMSLYCHCAMTQMIVPTDV